MAKKCSVCGRVLETVSKKFKCQDGLVCKHCLEQRGLLPVDGFGKKAVKSMTAEEIEEKPLQEKTRDAETLEKMRHFTPTFEVAGYAKFDDKSQHMMLLGAFGMRPKLEDYVYLRYNQIAGYQILTDRSRSDSYNVGIRNPLYGETVSLAGQMPLKRSLYHQIQIIVTLKDAKKPFHCITIKQAGGSSRTSSLNYRIAVDQARKIGNKLQLILDQVTDAEEDLDPVDDLRKYKELMDDGIITIAEFQKKKRELLGF